MYRRTGVLEDPWISLEDHSTAIGNRNIMYGENGYGTPHADIINNHNGADVYIRESTQMIQGLSCS